MASPNRLMTADELLELPDDDRRRELVAGFMVSEPPASFPFAASTFNSRRDGDARGGGGAAGVQRLRGTDVSGVTGFGIAVARCVILSIRERE